ncbi:piwi-like protein Ago3 [Zootermopsis nevadensis]|uniref:Piwi-like protein 1 n=1 Tax=Zootermopsis nevadensis TaxID=136037 RepID=A0A067R2W4_ZOONE|nr:piwi-like protein Ago3 [Zootermopsis nevadensis]XP_021933457.1 piwi-like protein Ago3 [Zootermopsis nevadensis]XP_021933458.1 piwi-like protein Ago3 [Zootermopsis nevadensis]KDR12118.1 Piwi-like protein 1 [Zootermopsis nevadensis]
MAGRGGRGAMLEAFFAQQRPGIEGNKSQSEAAAVAVVAGPPPAVTMSHGSGRASLLTILRNQSRVPGSVPPLQDVEEEPPLRNFSRGAALLNLKRNTSSPTTKSPASESSCVAPPGVVGPPTAKMAQMSFQESSGTSGKQPATSCPSAGPPGVPPRAAGSQNAQMSFQERPPVQKSGSSGKQIPATANYIRLHVEPGKGVYEYEVRFEPEVVSRGMQNKLLNEHILELGEAKTFDGVTLYLPIKLREEVTRYTSLHPVDRTPVSINITFKRKKRLGECIHLYNVLFRRIMFALDLARIGRQHFSPINAFPIPQYKLEVWPGYVTAVDEYEGGVQLCCDASHRVLRTQTVHELMEEIVYRKPSNYRDLVQKTIIGVTVLTRYNNRVYRIDDIDWNQSPSSTFSTHIGETISFKDYYKKHYDIDIQDLEQPLLLNRMKVRIRGHQNELEQLVCLVPELCFLTGLTDDMKNDFHVMKEIAMYTRITPNQRQVALKKFMKNIQENERAQTLLTGWGLKVDSGTVDLMARVLDPEEIIFGDNVSHRGTQQADWGAAATRNNVLSAVDLMGWMIVHCPRDTRCANEFAGMMWKIGPQMGIQVSKARIVSLRDDRTDSYLRMLRENINQSLQLVVIIFPSARDDRYSAVKKLCCSEMPIASQVINSRTLSKPDRLRSVVQKIALQINCKLGGTLWAVKIPLENCMVCGIDSYHDATKRGASVAAFVSSLNQTLTRWYSKVCFQGPGQELVDGLKTCLISALKYYYDVNHRFPDRIVVYRDGVGDGQLRISADYEVPQFESCFQHISPDYHPKLSVVICQKRINTRIFSALNAGRGDRGLENPPPGTIVDHTITRRNWYDFFLVSQHVRQGTVTPTHYVVIYDSANMKTDHMQRLTYKLCHLYYNWPGTIRVPAPCQYAHKLAQLVGQNIHRAPDERLSDRLYFL